MQGDIESMTADVPDSKPSASGTTGRAFWLGLIVVLLVGFYAARFNNVSVHDAVSITITAILDL